MTNALTRITAISAACLTATGALLIGSPSAGAVGPIAADDVIETQAISAAVVAAGVPVRINGVDAPAPLNGSDNVWRAETLPAGCKLDTGLDGQQFYTTVQCPATSTGGKVSIAASSWNASFNGGILGATRWDTTTLAFTKPTSANKVAPSISMAMPDGAATCANSEVLVPVTVRDANYNGIYGLSVKVSASVTPAGATRPVVTSGTGKTDTNGIALVTVKIPAGATVTAASTAGGMFLAATTSATPGLTSCTGATVTGSVVNWPAYGLTAHTNALATVNLTTSTGLKPSGTAAIALKYTTTTNAVKTVLLASGKLPVIAGDFEYEMRNMRQGMTPGGSSRHIPVRYKVPAAAPTDLKAGTAVQVIATITATSTGATTPTVVTLGNLPTINPLSIRYGGTVYAPSPTGGAAGFLVRSYANGNGPEECVPGAALSVVLRNAAGKESTVGSGKSDGLCTSIDIIAKPREAGTLYLKIAKATGWAAASTELGAITIPAAVTLTNAVVTGQAYQTLTAKVTPMAAGRTVTFYSSNAANTARYVIGTGTTNAAGVATTTWTPLAAGTWTLAALAASTSTSAAGESAARVVTTK
jgi:hypothetical protein